MGLWVSVLQIARLPKDFFFGSFFIFLQLNDGCKNFYQKIVKIYTYTTKNTKFIYIKEGGDKSQN